MGYSLQRKKEEQVPDQQNTWHFATIPELVAHLEQNEKATAVRFLIMGTDVYKGLPVNVKYTGNEDERIDQRLIQKGQVCVQVDRAGQRTMDLILSRSAVIAAATASGS